MRPNANPRGGAHRELWLAIPAPAFGCTVAPQAREVILRGMAAASGARLIASPNGRGYTFLVQVGDPVEDEPGPTEAAVRATRATLLAWIGETTSAGKLRLSSVETEHDGRTSATLAARAADVAFSIQAHPPTEANPNGYLAGSHLDGGDLPDGAFEHQTWLDIDKRMKEWLAVYAELDPPDFGARPEL